MPSFASRSLLAFLCTILTVFSLTNQAISDTCDPWAAQAVSVQGTVDVQPAGGGAWTPVTLNQSFCPGDAIRVGNDGRVNLLLANQSVLRLNADSQITLEGIEAGTTSVVDLKKGAAHFFSRVFKGLKVKTPFLTAGVRGTEFYVGVGPSSTDITIFEGGVLAVNEKGELNLAGGQSAQARQGQAPVMVTKVRPRDAVQWALYYPQVLYQPKAAEDTSDPRYLVQRAAGRLSTGRIDEATADLDEALRLDAGSGDALALKTVIAVVRNDKQNAMSLANQAVAASPDSAAPRVALSYAHQANFDLAQARQSLQEAVKIEPDNALAWARLAELNMSFGDLDAALDAANRAASIAPDVSRTQTVLGFAYLTQVKTAAAAEAFTRAITLDQADPLPRLGLGLAKIRDGNLAEGRQELETAASLDPNNSLIRSYLGKAYFEEKNTKYDGREYAEAKKLDPSDPTPWFYDAIRKQTINRPVEALEDLQKAIELNDNRAVYRSKLLLDSDLAARSASLARIYSDLGFQQRALVEGYNSVNTDPTNFSAHRFLADSYTVLPRHEIARVSELLQSQLLQPINITPIQPGLAESNLFLISSSGAADTGFNEFNPMFNRNRVTGQISGLYGQDDTRAVEGVVAGIYDRLSFSAGYTRFETDGWRQNADQGDSIGNIFAQYAFTPATSIQAELRKRKTDTGDVRLLFYEESYLPNFREEEESNLGRLGFKHDFSPQSTLIGNIAFQDSDIERSNLYDLDPRFLGAPFPPPPYVDYYAYRTVDQEASSVELQHLFRSRVIKTVAGAGHFSVDQDFSDYEEYYYMGALIIARAPDAPNLEIEHNNAYVYTYIAPWDVLTLTLGASVDAYEQKDDRTALEIDETQFNPKLGLTWQLFQNTTFRAAAFRTFKRTLITNQTLEPTQVAGFNQFFDDTNATQAWTYGGAVDQKFTNSIYGGLEYSYRDLDVPYFRNVLGPGGGLTLEEAAWDERFGRAYLYWAPLSWWSLSAEYIYEDWDRSDDLTEGIRELTTHRFPLGTRFFHSSGLSLGVKGTYVVQEGDFQSIDINNLNTFTKDDENFWVLDADIQYRLPKRMGFVSVGATNILDEKFRYFDTDENNPSLRPGTFLYVKLTIAVP